MRVVKLTLPAHHIIIKMSIFFLSLQTHVMFLSVPNAHPCCHSWECADGQHNVRNSSECLELAYYIKNYVASVSPSYRADRKLASYLCIAVACPSSSASKTVLVFFPPRWCEEIFEKPPTLVTPSMKVEINVWSQQTPQRPPLVVFSLLSNHLFWGVLCTVSLCICLFFFFFWIR